MTWRFCERQDCEFRTNRSGLQPAGPSTPHFTGAAFPKQRLWDGHTEEWEHLERRAENRLQFIIKAERMNPHQFSLDSDFRCTG